MRRESSENPGELMVRRYAPGWSCSSNRPSVSETDVVTAPPVDATAVTRAAAMAARIGSTTRPRNIAVWADAAADPNRKMATTKVRLSLRVTLGLYTRPFQSVKTELVGVHV